MNANGTYEKNAQLGDVMQKTRTTVLEVDHTNKTIKGLGSIVKSFSVNALTLDGAEFQGSIRKVLGVEELEGTTTTLTAVLEADGDVLITLDANATIRLTYLMA